MRSSELWLLCLALWDLTKADVVFKKPLDAELTAIWFPHQNVSSMTLCKNPCREQDILLRTWRRRKKNSRYSLTYEKKGSPPVDMVTVTISDLALSDSGRYRFIWRGPVQSYHSDFIVEVVEAGNSITVYSIAAGKDFSIPCTFYASGSEKTFCKNECSAEDILVKTCRDESQNGRYRIKYTNHAEDLNVLHMTIANVSSSDSGLYQCQLDQMPVMFRIEVERAPSTGDPWTVSPSGTPPNEKPEGSPAPGLLIQNIIAILSCVGLITITVTILIVCKERVWGMRSGGPNMEHDYENIPQPSNRGEYQDLRLENMDPPYSNLRWAVTARTAV